MVRLGRLGLGEGMHMPKSAMTLNEELIQIRQQIKVQEKELRHLKKEYFLSVWNLYGHRRKV